MPVFEMPFGSPIARADFMDLDAFTQGYIEALYWTEAEELGAAVFGDLTSEALAAITADCKAFQASHADDLGAYADHRSMEHAGHDFWLTRNRHGAGFWDRGLGPLGDRLADAAHTWGEVYAYVGDDGLVHIS